MGRSRNKQPHVKKEPLMVIKGQEITQKDYRAFIAILLSAAFVAALFVGNIDAIAALGPLAGSAATYYFHAKAMEQEF